MRALLLEWSYLYWGTPVPNVVRTVDAHSRISNIEVLVNSLCVTVDLSLGDGSEQLLSPGETKPSQALYLYVSPNSRGPDIRSTQCGPSVVGSILRVGEGRLVIAITQDRRNDTPRMICLY